MRKMLEEMPEEVVTFRREFLSDHSLDLYPIGRLLTNDSKKFDDAAEVIRMWSSFKRRKKEFGSRNIMSFLEAAHDAIRLPAFYLATAKERSTLSKQVKDHFANLTSILRTNELDVSFMPESRPKLTAPPWVPGPSEDLNRFLMLRLSTMLVNMSDRVLGVLADAETLRKGTTAEAVYFSRKITEFNRVYFGKALYAATAAATNRLFATQYSASEIRQHSLKSV
jgi:hypothetical protein